MNNIKQKLVKGGFWVTLQRLSGMLFNFLKLTVLTHFLSPAEFGIFGVALISLDIITYFSNTGFQQALIQRKGNIQPYLNSAWTFTIIRSFLTAAILFFLAPLAARFFNSPESVTVIRAISAILVVRAFVNIADIYLRKNLDFKTNFFYLIGGEVIDVLLSIVFAFVLRNYWALFIGYMARSVYRCILSYIIFKFRPVFELKINKLRELFNFGKWIFAWSVISVLAMYLDNILVGKLVGIAALGIYQVAFKFSHTGSGEVNNVLSQIYFPYFSVIQDDTQQVNKSYLSMLKMNIIIMSYLVVGMICLAPTFTILFLDSKWHSIIGIIQILAIASFLHSINSSASPFFRGKGKPKLLTYMQFVKVSCLIISIWILAGDFGIKGISYSVILAETFTGVYWFIKLRKMIPGFFSKLFRISIVPTIAAIVMGLVISLFWIIPGIENVDLNFVEFLLSGITGTLVFSGLIYFYTKVDPSYAQGLSFKKIFALFKGI